MEKFRKLKNYKASLKLKENVTPSYYEARKLLVHLLPLLVAKLQTLIAQDLLEYVTSGGSKWASPIIVVRKSDRDIRTCGDYKKGANQKVYLDLYPIPNVEVVLYALAGIYKNRFENSIPPNTNRQ